MPSEDTVLMEDAHLIFRNFAGEEGKYNREGDRNFCVLLPEQLAIDMAADGWNIKTLKARDGDSEERPYIQVSVGFKNRPPKIFMITSKGRTALSEDEVALLDWVDIKQADLIIRPYRWSVTDRNGVSTGIKAYVKSLFVIIDEDYLELKYADVTEINGRDYVDAEVVSEIRAIEGRKPF